MKQKRIAIIFIIFAAVVLLIVLGSTVFTVQNVRVIFLNEEGTSEIATPDRFRDLDVPALVSEYTGKSIFFLSKERMARVVEKQQPYLKIVKVVNTFPNRVDLYAVERVPLLQFSKEGMPVVTDSLGFVFPSSELEPGQKTIVVSMDMNEIVSYDGGELMTFTQKGQQLFGIVQTAIEGLWELDYDYAVMPLRFRSLSLQEDTLCLTTETGTNLVAKYAETDLKEKLNLLIAVYKQSAENQKNGLTITVTSKDSAPVVG